MVREKEMIQFIYLQKLSYPKARKPEWAQNLFVAKILISAISARKSSIKKEVTKLIVIAKRCRKDIDEFWHICSFHFEYDLNITK